LKIKKGDKVVILSGKDKGKTGEVTKAFPKDSKVIVSGVNIATRHRKATQQNPQAGWIASRRRCTSPTSRSRPRTASRPACASRVQDGKKVRVAVKTGEKIDG